MCNFYIEQSVAIVEYSFKTGLFEVCKYTFLDQFVKDTLSICHRMYIDFLKFGLSVFSPKTFRQLLDNCKVLNFILSSFGIEFRILTQSII